MEHNPESEPRNPMMIIIGDNSTHHLTQATQENGRILSQLEPAANWLHHGGPKRRGKSKKRKH